jgi:hypothetical protein
MDEQERRLRAIAREVTLEVLGMEATTQPASSLPSAEELISSHPNLTIPQREVLKKCFAITDKLGNATATYHNRELHDFFEFRYGGMTGLHFLILRYDGELVYEKYHLNGQGPPMEVYGSRSFGLLEPLSRFVQELPYTTAQ